MSQLVHLIIENKLQFKKIYLEISNLCNIQCSFCPVVERDNQIMSLDSILAIFDKINPFTQEVCLHLMGEPTAHPEFEKIIELAEIKGIKLNITTNGLLIKRKALSLLKSSAVRQVNFSLQSYRDNFPDKPLESYLLPILNFTKELFELRDDVYVNYRLWNVGATETKNNDFFRIIETELGIRINPAVQVEHIKSKKIWKKLYLHFDSRFEWPDLKRDELAVSGRCHGLGNHIGIHADGTVVPCCLDKEAVINLGNILESELDEILNSSLAKEIKTGFDSNVLTHDLCRRCQYIQRFKKGKNVPLKVS